jgi:glycosyltransferase involved in cell wall biosynthesis
MPTVHALFVTTDLTLASFRYRMRSLYSTLEASGWSVGEHELPRRRYVLRTWELRHRLRATDVVVLQQVKVSGVEARLLAHLARRAVLDIDDAIYLRKPRRPGGPAGTGRWRRLKFRSTCRAMDLVVAGNETLASAASRSAHRVEVVPTAIDLERYPRGPRDTNSPPTVVWIGRPENLISLELVRPALASLSRRLPELRVRVICSRFPEWPEVRIEPVQWSADTEVEALRTAHVGVMPLADDGWSRGKCAFKLLQYMAASLPCVASPVGANTDAVRDGETGYLAADVAAWETALERLLTSAKLRSSFGAAGRAHAERTYSMNGYRERYLAILQNLVDPST